MDKHDLLKILDLEGTEALSTAEDVAITPSEPTVPAAPARPTALDLDDWALRRGEDLWAENERLQALDLDDHAVADFHGAAFLPAPQLQSDCTDGLRHQFMQQLLETPDYQSLHTTTTLNAAASEIATTAFAEQFATLRKEPQADKAPIDREMATLRAVGRAVRTASEQVEECREAAAALGLGPGGAGSNDAHAIAALFKRVRGNPTLKRICELAGRYRRVAQSKQRRKAMHGLDDMVGVVLDGDLGRLLPQELVKLAVPEFEDDILRRLIERQCMVREYRATEPVGQGPIVVVVDESGSMDGEKVHTAKALALALAWVARQQRRWCALIAFSGGTEGRLLPLPPGRWDENALADWLTAFLGGGTTCDVPLVELPNRYWKELGCPAGQTDILCITDAIVRVPADVRDNFLRWKVQVQARLLSLIIQGRPGDLAAVSDEVHLVPSLAFTETAVERVLSL